MEKGKNMHKEYNGDQALALGAIAAGISMATSYPGSPSSGTMNALIELGRDYDLYVEWSANERVAIEMAIGASMAGRRSLVCTKSVGLNVMVDPLMCLNLTGVNAGLVILLGDDPGAYGSQNDQDTRLLAPFLELPLLEPSSPSQGFAMMKEAFDLSEKHNLAVIIRVTRSFVQKLESFSPEIQDFDQVFLGYHFEPYRFVPYPGNAVEMHRELHKRLNEFEGWANRSTYNEIIGSGQKGIVAVGFAYDKLLDIIGEPHLPGVSILQLSTLYPFPTDLIAQFLSTCEQVLVLEEIDPFVETQLKGAAFDLGVEVDMYGKYSGHVNWEGELFRWQISVALEQFLPEFEPKQTFLRENENAEYPRKINHCRHYAYEDVLALLQDVSRDLGLDPITIADPGCMVKVADQLDAKFAIGSAVAVASGISKARSKRKVVAFFGDSAFFHSTIPAICNAAYNQSDVLMILLDNSGAASTGLQPSMSTGLDAFGEPAPRLNIQNIAQACGVEYIRSLASDAKDAEIRESIKAGLNFRGLALVIIQVEYQSRESIVYR